MNDRARDRTDLLLGILIGAVLASSLSLLVLGASIIYLSREASRLADASRNIIYEIREAQHKSDLLAEKRMNELRAMLGNRAKPAPTAQAPAPAQTGELGNVTKMLGALAGTYGKLLGGGTGDVNELLDGVEKNLGGTSTDTGQLLKQLNAALQGRTQRAKPGSEVPEAAPEK